jgi:ATP dependent DNA ligase C terminal region
VLEVDERAVWPEPLTEFVARDEIARPLQQQCQHLESLFLEGDPHSSFPQLARPTIQFKDAKPDKARRRGHLWHASSSAQRVHEIGAILAWAGPRPAARAGIEPEHGQLLAFGVRFTVNFEDVHPMLATSAAQLPEGEHWSYEGITAEDVTALRWVKPRIVADVAFVEWTRDGLLRHPEFVGIRTDKGPRAVTPAA